MIATPNLRIRLLKPFLVFCLIVGALFCAPAVSADNTAIHLYQHKTAAEKAQDIAERYGLTDYTYFGFSQAIGSGYDYNTQRCFVFDVSELSSVNDISFRVDYTQSGNSISYRIAGCNCPVYTSDYFFDLSYSAATLSNGTYSFGGTNFSNLLVVENGIAERQTPLLCTTLFDVDNIIYDSAFISFSGSDPTVQTDSQTYAEAMLQEYLHSEGFTPDMATAWLIAPSGQPTQIPLSYSTPENFNEDIWIKCENATPYLDKFTPQFSDSFNAIDYQGYKLAISYDLDVSYVKLYALTDKQYSHDYDINLYINDTIRQDSSLTLPQTKGYYDFDGFTYFGSLYEQDNNSQNVRELLYCIWDFNPTPAAAIPRFVPLYCALDVRTVDSNGDTLISRDSNDYRQFVTNYNQRAITGLTGSYTGKTFGKQDWRGQSVSQDVDYHNDFTITYDSNLGEVFRTIFSMGNGYILTLCIGGLSIAFAAYVLFGKH